jgi:hypothetical protein
MTGGTPTPGEPTFQVLATVGVFEPGFRGGGPIRSLVRIVDSAPELIEISIGTLDHPNLTQACPVGGSIEIVRVFTILTFVDRNTGFA